MHKSQHLVLGSDELRLGWTTDQEVSSSVERKTHACRKKPGELTGLCPAGWVSYGRSAPGQGPADCAPKWSSPHCSLRSAPSETHTYCTYSYVHKCRENDTFFLECVTIKNTVSIRQSAVWNVRGAKGMTSFIFSCD